MLALESAFAKAFGDNEYLAFDRVAKPLHPRRDICAFIMLDKLAPCRAPNIIASAIHDEIYLATDLEALAMNATLQDIVDLVRCGVRYSASGLCMFI